MERREESLLLCDPGSEFTTIKKRRGQRRAKTTKGMEKKGGKEKNTLESICNPKRVLMAHPLLI